MNNKYERSSQETEETLVNWNGVLNFHNVFVTQFPEPFNAHRLSSGLWNNNGIYLAQAQYGGNMKISITCSTLPENRTANEDINILCNHLMGMAEEYGTTSNGYELMRVMPRTTEFGDTIIYEMTNIAFEGASGPFPLDLGGRYSLDNGLQSMSLSAIFHRPEVNSRVELSILYKLPEDFKANPGQDVAGDLYSMLAEMLQEFLYNTYHLTAKYLGPKV